MTPPDGAILAGGSSIRMGRDKDSVVLPCGLTMLQKACLTLGSCISGSLLISGPMGVPDIHAGMGPMGGMESILNVSNTHGVLFLPCDMPHVLPAHVNRLLESYARFPDRPAVAMSPLIQPLFAVVPVTWSQRLSNAISRGHLKVGRFWMDSEFTPVSLPRGELLRDADYPWEVIAC